MTGVFRVSCGGVTEFLFGMDQMAKFKLLAQMKPRLRDGLKIQMYLDTWFSSGQWAFSTFGWPEKSADLAKFYPTSVLVTGYDILFFWVVRMMMMSTFAMDGVPPFKTIMLHGLSSRPIR